MALKNVMSENNYNLFCESLTSDSIDVKNVITEDIITNNINIIDTLQINGDVGNEDEVLFSSGTNAYWDKMEAPKIRRGPDDSYIYSDLYTSSWVKRNGKFALFTPQGAKAKTEGFDLEPGAQDIANLSVGDPKFSQVLFQNELISNTTAIRKDINQNFTALRNGYYKFTFTGPVVNNNNSIIFAFFKNNIGPDFNPDDNYGISCSGPVDTAVFSDRPLLDFRNAISSSASIVRIILLNAGDFICLCSAMQASKVETPKVNYFTAAGSASLIVEYLGQNLISI